MLGVMAILIVEMNSERASNLFKVKQSVRSVLVWTAFPEARPSILAPDHKYLAPVPFGGSSGLHFHDRNMEPI